MMNTLRFYQKLLLSCVLIFPVTVLGQTGSYSASEFSASPSLLTDTTDPFVMISLSVELTQQAEAYTDGEQTYVQNGTYCPGRQYAGGDNWDGVCYTNKETYIGYFDPNKCYDYYVGDDADSIQTSKGADLEGKTNPSYFYPVGKAVGHQCSGLFSGNFMNWATMTALDEFRSAMTGGARIVDTKGADAVTLLTRTHRYNGDWSDWNFVWKKISKLGFTVGADAKARTFTNDPSTVSPFTKNDLHIDNGNYDGIDDAEYGNRVRFVTGWSSGRVYAEYKGVSWFNVIVKVCDKEQGLESNCVAYSDGENTWYKPEGVMQKNAMNMRYALASYSASMLDKTLQDGGVLRSNAKYIGYYRKAEGGGIEINPAKEIDEYGRFVWDPEGKSGGTVYNSGILNYINNFGLAGERYKVQDPVAELYYESLRYMMGASGPTKEYVSALVPLSEDYDGFPVLTSGWEDPITDACQANFMMYIGDQFGHSDYDLPGMSIGHDPTTTDTGANLSSLLATIDGFEGHPWDLTTRRDSNGMSFGIAGLAYFALMNDLSDKEGVQTAKTFIVDTQEYKASPPAGPYNPLWLAAKYGGFDDLDGNKNPKSASNSEWDKDGDGSPDTYTLASQPANLVRGLQNAFSEISDKISAGSAAGVVSNTISGQGMVVQGLFKPSLTDDLGSAFEWGGIVHSMFVDEYNNLREDSDGDGLLTTADSIITFETDPDTKEVTVQRFTTTDNGKSVEATYAGGGDEFTKVENIKTLWNARDELAKLNSDLDVQRSYSSVISPDSASRYIITAIDADQDGLVIPGTSEGSDYEMDFIDSKFPSTSIEGSSVDKFRLLGLDSTTAIGASNIVNFIRGEEITGFRSRMVDYDGDGVKENWRFGDLVSSSPIIVGKPLLTERYDLIYDDSSYKDFYTKYKDRRHVVYAGANDGMLHAFNAGFFTSSTVEVEVDDGSGGTTTEEKTNYGYLKTLSGETAHPLGAELWAYVPYNLLPHLKWLTEYSYPHVFYVDGEPQTFDVNIFPDDADHPNGWGTILVVGMRFGGGEYIFDSNSDGDDGDPDDDITMRSAYIILDITNPESPPKLVAEISHELMGYTMSRPTVVKARTDSVNKWYLVMGSGPYGSTEVGKASALQYAVSEQKSKIFVFNLNDKYFEEVGGSGKTYFEVPDESNGFTGDFISVDWDEDYIDDAVYFGTVTGSIMDPTGDFWRIALGTSTNLIGGMSTSISRVVENSGGTSLGLPVSARPYAYRYRDKNWLTFGTGRFYVDEDALSVKQMGYYGVKDNTGAPLLMSDLIDTTNVSPQFIVNPTDPWSGIIYDSSTDMTTPGITLDGVNIDNYVALRSLIHEKEPGGWYYDFRSENARHIGGTWGEGPVILFSEYWPNADVCDPLGNSHISQLYIGTGHAAPFFELNIKEITKTSEVEGEADEAVQDRWIMGVIGKVIDAKVPQSNTGEMSEPVDPDTILTKKGITSWREIPVNW